MKVQDIYIYTIGGAVLHKAAVVPATAADFENQLCSAIDNGGAMVDTADKTKLIINTAAVAAVEIGILREEGTADLTVPHETEEIPPGRKIGD